MLGFLGFIVLFILLLLLMVVAGILSVGSRLLHALFGGKRTSSRQKADEAASSPTEAKPRHKIFDKDEGEYVDFEEIL